MAIKAPVLCSGLSGATPAGRPVTHSVPSSTRRRTGPPTPGGSGPADAAGQFSCDGQARSAHRFDTRTPPSPEPDHSKFNLRVVNNACLNQFREASSICG
jgi:hypothetical protein